MCVTFQGLFYIKIHFNSKVTGDLANDKWRREDDKY